MCLLQTVSCNVNEEPHGIDLKDLMKNGVNYLTVMFTPRVRVIKMSKIVHFLYFFLIAAKKVVTIWQIFNAPERPY